MIVEDLVFSYDNEYCSESVNSKGIWSIQEKMSKDMLHVGLKDKDYILYNNVIQIVTNQKGNDYSLEGA